MNKEKKDIESLVVSKFLAFMDIPSKNLQSRERPDFVVHCDGKPLGLELAQYRTPGPHRQSEGVHDEFRKNVEEFLSKEFSDEDVSLDFDVGINIDKNGYSKFKIRDLQPQKSDISQELKQELKRLVEVIPMDGGFYTVYLDLSTWEAANTTDGTPFRNGDEIWVNPGQWPILHAHCGQIGISRRRTVGASVFTNLEWGAVELDETELANVVRNHIEKIGNYRKSVSGEIWLILYNEGVTVSTVIGRLSDSLRATISSVVYREQQSGTDRFDRVYWGQDVLLGKSHEQFFLISTATASCDHSPATTDILAP